MHENSLLSYTSMLTVASNSRLVNDYFLNTISETKIKLGKALYTFIIVFLSMLIIRAFKTTALETQWVSQKF